MLPLIFVLIVGSLPALPTQTSQSTSAVRPCAVSWNAPSEPGKKHSKNPVEAQVQTGACIEMSFSVLEIQEYLQAYTRKQEWNISNEQLGEDSWTFARELTKDELLQCTKRTPETETIAWTRGTVSLRVSTVVLADGFTRTVIRTSYRGYGESTDKFAAQKKYWELESNGKLEESLVSALRSHFQSASRSAGSN